MLIVHFNVRPPSYMPPDSWMNLAYISINPPSEGIKLKILLNDPVLYNAMSLTGPNWTIESI